MRAKVAIATLLGKAYFIIVSELKQRRIPFISVFPGDPVPTEIQVVVTTRKEAPLVSHHRVIIYDSETDPKILGSEIIKALQGKEAYEKVVVGVDPGDVYGVAVVADGAVVDSENCFSVKETTDRIRGVMKTVDPAKSSVTVKIGSGTPAYRELLKALEKVLPSEVMLEIVEEAGTDRHVGEAQHGREVRHIVSAIKIAGRTGCVYPRRQSLEQES